MAGGYMATRSPLRIKWVLPSEVVNWVSSTMYLTMNTPLDSLIVSLQIESRKNNKTHNVSKITSGRVCLVFGSGVNQAFSSAAHYFKETFHSAK